MGRKGIFILSLLCLALPASLRAESSPTPAFFRLNSEEGLSHSTANDIFVDERGVVWVATKDGLNSFDGRNVKVFKQDDPDVGNTIGKLTGDNDGHLFLALPNHLGIFDMRDGSLRNIRCGEVGGLAYRDSLFVGTGHEIRCLPNGSTEFSVYAALDAGEEITALAFVAGRLLAGTRQGHVFSITPGQTPERVLDSGKVADIYADSGGNAWICTWTNGLFRLAPDGSLKNFRHTEGRPGCISSDFVRSCCEDARGRLWIGSIKGLDYMDPATGTVGHISNDPSSHFALSDESIWKIRRDRQGNMWLATYYGGVDYFNLESDMYTLYESSSMEGKGLSNPVVGEMVEDGDFIWIATEGGLDRLDRRDGSIRWYGVKPGRGPQMEHMKALWLDKDAGELWAGADMGGLFRVDCFDGSAEAFYHDPGDPGTIPGDRVRDIIPYGPDSLIVATQSGLCVFSRSAGRGRQLLLDGKSAKVVVDVMLDSNGMLWIKGGEDSLRRLDMNNGKVTFWSGNGAPGRLPTCTFQDSQGRIWAGSFDSGLYIYNKETDDFRAVSKGLFSSENIYAIRELQPGGELIVATGCGFSLFDPDSGRARNFDHPGGFPFTSSYENALLVTGDGTVFIGSTQGMASFPISYLFRSRGRSDILINSYSCAGELFPLGYGCSAISVRSGSPLNFDISVTDFIPASRDCYEYIVEGLQEQWTALVEPYRIDVPKLRPGKYTLRIRSAEADETICTPACLTINVSWAALPNIIALMAVLIASAAVVIITSRRRQLQSAVPPAVEEPDPTPSQLLYNKAKSIVEANLGNKDFDIQQFCSQIGMSRTVLFGKIKEVSDKTPNDFILGIRLAKAEEMLRKDYESSIADIAEKTGFSSAAYFSQKFKDAYGLTPLAYRKKEMPK